LLKYSELSTSKRIVTRAFTFLGEKKIKLLKTGKKPLNKARRSHLITDLMEHKTLREKAQQL